MLCDEGDGSMYVPFADKCGDTTVELMGRQAIAVVLLGEPGLNSAYLIQ